jgi:hypothetical protein
MKSRGRPITRQAKLMDGFYIEVRNRGSRDRAVKIRSENKLAMEGTAVQYKRFNKEVTVLGEYKNEIWLN